MGQELEMDLNWPRHFIFLVLLMTKLNLLQGGKIIICVTEVNFPPKHSPMAQYLNKTAHVLSNNLTSSGLDAGVQWVELHSLFTENRERGQCDLLLVAASCDCGDSVRFLLAGNIPQAVVLADGDCLTNATVAMAPWAAEWASAISDVVEQLQWESVVLVTDGSLPALERELQVMLSTQRVGLIRLHVEYGVQTVEPDNFTSQVQLPLSALPPAVRAFILCSSPQTATGVLRQAEKLGLLDRYFYWLMVCDIDQSFSSFLTALTDPQVNLGLLQPASIPVKAADTQLSCQYSGLPESFWRQELLKRIFERLPSNVTANLLSVFQESVSETGTVPSYELELCAFDPRAHPHFKQEARWRKGLGWDPLLTAGKFLDFGQKVLRIGTISASPFVFRREVNNTTEYEGFCIDILKEFASQLKFSYVLVESPDNKYGAPEEDGSWNGMVGLVARGEVDMGVGPYTISSIRETVVDFSVPFMEDGGGILTKKGNSQTSILTGLSTFSGTIWLCVAGTTLVMAVSLYVTGRYSPCSDFRDSDERRQTWTLGACLVYVCGSVMMQGMEKHPSNVSARCVLACWWLFTVLILSVYTAKLASVLTVEVQGSRIDSLEDLLASSVNPFVATGSIWDSFFKAIRAYLRHVFARSSTNFLVQSPTTTTYRKIAQRMTDMPEVLGDADALSLVSTGAYAYLHDVNNLKYLYSTDCEKLHLASSIFNSNGLGVILPKNAPYKDAIDTIILRLQEGGILEKWRSKWWPTGSQCGLQSAASVRDASQLGVDNIGGMLLVYLAVAVLALLCFAAQLGLRRTGVADKLRRTPCSAWLQNHDENHQAAATTSDA